MNFRDVLAALNQASGFELYRLRSVLDRMLSDPKWIAAIQQHLHIGKSIEYYETRTNRLCVAQIIEFRKKDVLVLQQETGQYWQIPMTAINLDGHDVHIREKGQAGLGRHEIAVGETVGFLDHEQQQRQGCVVRLNDKTVTVDCDGQKWRVGYGFLHRVLNIDGN